MLKKIKISPESCNYGDNDENVAYLYRAANGVYIIWKETWTNVGDRGGSRDEWSYGPAVLRVPNAALGDTFDPYWDDNGDTHTCDSRRACVFQIDRLHEQGLANPAPELTEADPDDEENITLVVSKNQVRVIQSALSRRADELDSLGGQQAVELRDEAKAVYQSIDSQAFASPKS